MNGSIRSRGKGTWELTVDLGRDAEGKRKRKFVTVKGTKAQSQQRLRAMLSLTGKGIPVATTRITFSQWLTKWMAGYVIPKLRQKTIERYQGLIDKHLVPYIGHVELTKLTPIDVATLEAKLLDNGMAPKGVEMVHNVISGAYKYAVSMEVAWRNPVKSVTPPKVIRKEVEPPEIAKVRGILSLAEAEEHPLFACFHLIAYTGLRRGEAIGLRHQDLNLEAGTISIVQTISRSLNKGIIVEPTKTNAGRRMIDLDAETIDVLRAHLGKQLLRRMELEGSYEDNGLVFPGPLGEPLNPMAVTRGFQSFAKRMGFNGGKVHDLKHFHASVMLQNGQSLLLVSKRLGHASVSTTGDVYGHLLPGWQKEAANAFAKAIQEG